MPSEKQILIVFLTHYMDKEGVTSIEMSLEDMLEITGRHKGYALNCDFDLTKGTFKVAMEEEKK